MRHRSGRPCVPFGARYSWDRMAEPLLDYCRAPWKAADRGLRDRHRERGRGRSRRRPASPRRPLDQPVVAPLSASVAFVTPRFGAEVVGGSEAVMREIALGLTRRGHRVEVLTTTAIDHQSWTSVLRPGVTTEQGLVVRRFETVPNLSGVGVDTTTRIMRGERTTLDEQVSWLSHPFRVPDLFMHLLAHGEEYDYIVFSPYLVLDHHRVHASRCRPCRRRALLAQRAVRAPRGDSACSARPGIRLVPLRARARAGPPARTGDRASCSDGGGGGRSGVLRSGRFSRPGTG